MAVELGSGKVAWAWQLMAQDCFSLPVTAKGTKTKMPLLDPTVFSGSNGASRLAVSVGKNGKVYIMNADSLGGFKQGAGGADNVLQTLQVAGAIFGGSGSYPLEGGYIYFLPIGGPMAAFRFGRDGAGNPLFTQVGETEDKSAGRTGNGIPTITSFKGQPGSAIVWVTDVDAGLRAYRAIPDASGKLAKIDLPPTPGLNKFQRPAFGDGRLYVSDASGHVICLGAPVNLPLSCTSPVSFGPVRLGSAATQTVSCTALVPIQSVTGLVTSDVTWQASNSSLPQRPLAQNQTFNFPIAWNLTEALVANEKNASFGAVSPGVKSGSVTIYTNGNSSPGLQPVPISLTGTQVSSEAFLALTPRQIDFGGEIVSADIASSLLHSSFNIINSGNQSLTVTGYAYSSNLDSPVADQNTSQAGNATQVGPNFTSSNLPLVGSSIVPGKSITVSVDFSTNQTGNYQNILTVWSDGGLQYILMTATATSPSAANISISRPDGGFDALPSSSVLDFCRVQAGTNVTRKIRICNGGGGPLRITKSKPPGQPELQALHPTTNLAEGQLIAARQCAMGTIEVVPALASTGAADRNISDIWTLNTDDPKFGLRVVQIQATIFS